MGAYENAEKLMNAIDALSTKLTDAQRSGDVLSSDTLQAIQQEAQALEEQYKVLNADESGQNAIQTIRTEYGVKLDKTLEGLKKGIEHHQGLLGDQQSARAEAEQARKISNAGMAKIEQLLRSPSPPKEALVLLLSQAPSTLAKAALAEQRAREAGASDIKEVKISEQEKLKGFLEQVPADVQIRIMQEHQKIIEQTLESASAKIESGKLNEARVEIKHVGRQRDAYKAVYKLAEKAKAQGLDPLEAQNKALMAQRKAVERAYSDKQRASKKTSPSAPSEGVSEDPYILPQDAVQPSFKQRMAHVKENLPLTPTDEQIREMAAKKPPPVIRGRDHQKRLTQVLQEQGPPVKRGPEHTKRLEAEALAKERQASHLRKEPNPFEPPQEAPPPRPNRHTRGAKK